MSNEQAPSYSVFKTLYVLRNKAVFLAYANYDVRKMADLRIFGIDRGETEQLLAASQTTAKIKFYELLSEDWVSV